MRVGAACEPVDRLRWRALRVRGRRNVLRLGCSMTPADLARLVDAGGTVALCLVLWQELRRVRDGVEALALATSKLVVLMETHEREDKP